jgi:hypothetical protein
MRQGVPQDGVKLWHDSQLCREGEKHDNGRRQVTAEPKMKKPRVEASGEDKTTEAGEKATMA